MKKVKNLKTLNTFYYYQILLNGDNFFNNIKKYYEKILESGEDVRVISFLNPLFYQLWI